MKNYVLVETGEMVCAELLELIAQAIVKHYGKVDFDIINDENNGFILPFNYGENSAKIFVVDFLSEIKADNKVTKMDYRKTDWDDAYPAYHIELLNNNSVLS